MLMKLKLNQKKKLQMNEIKDSAAGVIKHQQLQNDFDLARKIGNSNGFFEYYFEVLPAHPTNKAAFEEVNSEYSRFFDEKKYINYNSFRQQLSKWLTVKR